MPPFRNLGLETNMKRQFRRVISSLILPVALLLSPVYGACQSSPLAQKLSAVAAQATVKAVPVKTAAGSHSLVIKPDGSLWAWGANDKGQLGDGSTADRGALARVGADRDWVSVAVGGSHSVALKADGSLWAWGGNDKGQLGIDTGRDDATGRRVNMPQPTPGRIGTDKDWASVWAGESHTMALKKDGSLWAWGLNDKGQLGDGAKANRSAPTRIGATKDWASVSVGRLHTMALKADGSLWAWGENEFGQLGLGDGKPQSQPAPTQVGTAKDWKAVSVGGSHTVALKSDGSLWTWGRSREGQLGYDTERDDEGYRKPKNAPARVGTDKDWAAVTAGSDSTMAMKSDGSLWAWGKNNSGQLGFDTGHDPKGAWLPRFAPDRVDGAQDWTTVSTDGSHTVAMKTNGSLWVWGANDKGQLGDGTTTNRKIPVRARVRLATATEWSAVWTGGEHIVAQKADGSLWAWGANDRGQLGDGTTTKRSFPVRVGGEATDWTAVSPGRSHTMALKSDGGLWAWGSNQYGQLGDGTTINRNAPVRVGTGWVAVSARSNYTLALKKDGSLWGWGQNDAGQLGVGSNRGGGSPLRVGEVGDSKNAQPAKSNSASDKLLNSLAKSNSTGRLLNSLLSDVGNNDWTAVSVGTAHAVALKKNGTLWTWGKNDKGQLGDGAKADRNSPAQVGTARDWAAVWAGDFHTVAQKKDGSLWAWGSNQYGQLGDGTSTNRNAPVRVGNANDWTFVSAGAQSTAALKADGGLWVWGNAARNSSPLRVGADSAWTAVAVNACALKADGSLWTWGTALWSGAPTRAGAGEPRFVDWDAVSAGDGQTILADGGVWAWKSNEYSRVGDGETTKTE